MALRGVRADVGAREAVAGRLWPCGCTLAPSRAASLPRRTLRTTVIRLTGKGPSEGRLFRCLPLALFLLDEADLSTEQAAERCQLVASHFLSAGVWSNCGSFVEMSTA